MSDCAPQTALRFSPADWQLFEEQLSYAHGYVELLVDDYVLTCRVRRAKELTYVIDIYVNGWFRVEWTLHDCEARRRFMRPRTEYLFKPAQRAALRKSYGRRKVPADAISERKHTWYSSTWPTAKALRRHLVANNTHIEWHGERPQPLTADPEV